MKTLQQFKAKALKDPALMAAYDALEPEYNLIATLIEKRLERGWSQKELAEAIGSKQPVISRLERGTYNPSVKFLSRIAQALDTRLQVTFV